MAYRVELTFRAMRDLECLYAQINAVESSLARRWFDGLERGRDSALIDFPGHLV